MDVHEQLHAAVALPSGWQLPVPTKKIQVTPRARLNALTSSVPAWYRTPIRPSASRYLVGTIAVNTCCSRRNDAQVCDVQHPTWHPILLCELRFCKGQFKYLLLWDVWPPFRGQFDTGRGYQLFLQIRVGTLGVVGTEAWITENTGLQLTAIFLRIATFRAPGSVVKVISVSCLLHGAAVSVCDTCTLRVSDSSQFPFRGLE